MTLQLKAYHNSSISLQYKYEGACTTKFDDCNSY